MKNLTNVHNPTHTFFHLELVLEFPTTMLTTVKIPMKLETTSTSTKTTSASTTSTASSSLLLHSSGSIIVSARRFVAQYFKGLYDLVEFFGGLFGWNILAFIRMRVECFSSVGTFDFFCRGGLFDAQNTVQILLSSPRDCDQHA